MENHYPSLGSDVDALLARLEALELRSKNNEVFGNAASVLRQTFQTTIRELLEQAEKNAVPIEASLQYRPDAAAELELLKTKIAEMRNGTNQQKILELLHGAGLGGFVTIKSISDAVIVRRYSTPVTSVHSVRTFLRANTFFDVHIHYYPEGKRTVSGISLVMRSPDQSETGVAAE